MPETYTVPPRSATDAADPRDLVRLAQIATLLATPWKPRATSAPDTVAVGEALWVDAGQAGVAGRAIALPSSPTPGQLVLVGKADTVAANPVRLVGTINGDADGGRINTPGTAVTLLYVSAAFEWRSIHVSNGAAVVTDVPLVEARLTTAYTALPSNDYLMAGNMTPGPDPFGMWSTAFSFYRVIVPAAGRYDIEWSPFLYQTGGAGAAKVLLNVPNNTASSTAVQGYSRLTAVSPTGGEGCPPNIRRTIPLVAGDALSFAVYSTTQFDMPVTRFGGLETRLTVRYAGRS